MKIKTKLAISFCIILFVPIVLFGCTMVVFQKIQAKNIEVNYGISDGENYVWTNQIQLLNKATADTVKEIQDLVRQDADQLKDQDTQEKLEAELEEKSSYLVVRVDDEIIYYGDSDATEQLTMPSYGTSENSDEINTFMDSEDDVLMKQIDFLLSDGSQGSAFIVTPTTSMIPEYKDMIIEGMAAIILILLVTAIMLIVWVYQSLVTPVRKLQAAADNIKNGNLDFALDVTSCDEMGELCQSFEAMRLRLKDNAEEKLQDEKENRALISNIAHDLKTPITAVKGYSEGILDGVANTPEKVEKYVRTIYNKANEMDTLINELTLYSKIDTNRIPYNFAKIKVNEYFDDCVEEIGLDLEAKQIGLAYFNYVEENVEIIADPEQLRRVVSNIIGNSVKYMNKTKGMINIRIKDVGDFIQVEIEDNGRGIAARDLPYIFDRFYRADASRNSATGGSGIGLSIVKKIIEDHGGKIWATSKEDTGTVMYFVIRKYQEVFNEDVIVDEQD